MFLEMVNNVLNILQKYFGFFSLLFSSSTIAVIVAWWLGRKLEKKRMKIQTLKDFFGYRFDIYGDNFKKAINEIYIVFKDSDEVVKALDELHAIATSTTKKEEAEPKLKKLAAAMCRDVKIKFDPVREEFFIRPFKFNDPNKPN